MKLFGKEQVSIFRTNVWINGFLFIILLNPFFACSTSPKKIITHNTGFEFKEATLSRDVEKKEKDSIPVGQSTVFYTNDTEVVSRIKVANITGKHKIRWDWHKPNGSLYMTTGSQTIKIPSGKIRKEMSLWHKITLYGEAAVDNPGRWLANIYIDNNIVSSQHFEIKPEINIDKLPKMTQASNPDHWGLIIGIENYAKLPAVDFAEKDARLVQDYFKNLLGIPEKNIITLIDSEATKGKIEGILRIYLPLNLSENATLYVYFAGHGVPSLEGGDAFIVTYDGEPKLIEYTGYKLETLYADISNLPAKRSIVFIDGCFSGVSSRSDKVLITGARPAMLKVKNMNFASGNVIAMTASQGDQISNSYPEKEHGLFTYYMLSGMRGAADMDGDEMVTLDELYTYVNLNVVKVSRRTGVEQTPDIQPGTDAVKKINVSRVVKE